MSKIGEHPNTMNVQNIEKKEHTDFLSAFISSIDAFISEISLPVEKRRK